MTTAAGKSLKDQISNLTTMYVMIRVHHSKSQMKRLGPFRLKTLLILVFSLTLWNSHSQNLVMNPGFEDYLSCDFPALIDTSTVVPSSCPHWWTATQKPAGHNLRCQARNNGAWWFTPNSGNAFSEVVLVHRSPPIFHREDDRVFLQTRLRSPLKAGCTYEVSFYARPFAKNRPAGNYWTGPVFTNSLGALLTSDRPTDHLGYLKIIDEVPQIQSNTYLVDTTTYHRISGQITAAGGEQYLTIGIFTPIHLLSCKTRDDSVIARRCNTLIFIDDVSVKGIPTGPTYANLLPNNISITPGDNIRLNTDNPNTIWSTGITGRSITVDTPGKYWYTIEEPCFTYTDTVIVSSEELIIHIPNAFTPNGDGLNEQFEVGVYGVTRYRASVYDRWGNMVYEHSGERGIFKWDGKINGREAPAGIYMLRIDTDGRHGSQSRSEMIHLIR